MRGRDYSSPPEIDLARPGGGNTRRAIGPIGPPFEKLPLTGLTRPPIIARPANFSAAGPVYVEDPRHALPR
jgi:hypothetical protein